MACAGRVGGGVFVQTASSPQFPGCVLTMGDGFHRVSVERSRGVLGRPSGVQRWTVRCSLTLVIGAQRGRLYCLRSSSIVAMCLRLARLTLLGSQMVEDGSWCVEE
jgi:hypothetical protein